MSGHGWGKAEETVKKLGENSKKFIKLEDDGDKCVVVFLGEPFAREVFWDNKLDKYVPFTPELEAAGKKPSGKFSMNAYAISEGNGDKITKVDALKIFECSAITFKDVLKVRDKYGLEKYSFEVERHGKAKDTKTTYTILPDKPIAEVDGLAAKLKEASVKLHDLEKTDDDDDKDGKGKGAKDFGTYDKDKKASGGASDKISADATQALTARLKQLPREAVEKYLAKFGVAKVKETLASDLDTAKAFVDELEGKKAAPAAVDPFAD